MRLNFSYVPLALVTSFDWSCHDKYVFKLNIRLQRYKIFFKNALFRALNMRKVGEDVFSIQVLRLAWRGLHQPFLYSMELYKAPPTTLPEAQIVN